MFPPKNETEETCNTDRQREGKTKGRAVLLPLMEHAGQTGVVGTHWAGAVGQGSLELWGWRGVSATPAQHNSAQEGEKGPCNRFWALGNSQELPCPGTFSGSTISTFQH